jgi:hypothetical protein
MLDRTPSRELQEHLWVFPWTIQSNSLVMPDELHVAVLKFCKHFPEFDGESPSPTITHR